jgi:GH24 family phage-related lysozyme (muramidase)
MANFNPFHPQYRSNTGQFLPAGTAPQLNASYVGFQAMKADYDQRAFGQSAADKRLVTTIINIEHDSREIQEYFEDIIEALKEWDGSVKSLRVIAPVVNEVIMYASADPLLSAKDEKRVQAYGKDILAFIADKTSLSGRIKQTVHNTVQRATSRENLAKEADNWGLLGKIAKLAINPNKERAGRLARHTRAESLGKIASHLAQAKAQSTAAPTRALHPHQMTTPQRAAAKKRRVQAMGKAFARQHVAKATPVKAKAAKKTVRAHAATARRTATQVQKVAVGGNTGFVANPGAAAGTGSGSPILRLIYTNDKILATDQQILKEQKTHTTLLKAQIDADKEREEDDERRSVEDGGSMFGEDSNASVVKEKDKSGGIFSGLGGLFGNLGGMLKGILTSSVGMEIGKAIGGAAATEVGLYFANKGIDVVNKNQGTGLGKLDTETQVELDAAGAALATGNFMTAAGLAAFAGARNLWKQKEGIGSLLTTPVQTYHAVQDLAGSLVAGQGYYDTKAAEVANEMSMPKPSVPPPARPVTPNVDRMPRPTSMSPTGVQTLKSGVPGTGYHGEGFTPVATDDAGSPAIGYGMHEWQGKPVSAAWPGRAITQQEADTELDRQLRKKIYPKIQRDIKVPLTQDQFDTLASFAWNNGPGWHNMAQHVNNGTVTPDYFLKSATVHGKPNKGLVARREYEGSPFAMARSSAPAVNALSDATNRANVPLVIAPQTNVAGGSGGRGGVVAPVMPMPMETRHPDPVIHTITGANNF